MATRPEDPAPEAPALPAPGEALPFEDALSRLEAIVRRLEAGDVPLEASLADFEEGIRLSRLCTARLDEAERKVALLLAEGDGISEVDFETGEVLARRGGRAAPAEDAFEEDDLGDEGLP